jgi:hypothetical protein
MSLSNLRADDPFTHAVESIVRAGMDDPIFRRSWLLACAKQLNMADTLSVVHAFTAKASPIRWERLGYPETEQCRTMSMEVRRTAAALEQGETKAFESACMPGLLVYAAVREFLPLTFEEVVATLGVELCINRLRHFADVIDSCVMFG